MWVGPLSAAPKYIHTVHLSTKQAFHMRLVSCNKTSGIDQHVRYLAYIAYLDTDICTSSSEDQKFTENQSYFLSYLTVLKWVPPLAVEHTLSHSMTRVSQVIASSFWRLVACSVLQLAQLCQSQEWTQGSKRWFLTLIPFLGAGDLCSCKGGWKV